MAQSIGSFRSLTLFTTVLLLSVSIYSCGETDNDPRYHKLQLAMNKMSTEPDPADSVANTLKTILGLASMDGFAADRFEYYTDSTDTKVLILVKIPELNTVLQSERDVFLSLTDKMTNTGGWEGKQKFIGIFGRKNLMLCKTPLKTYNKNSLPKSLLYDYFGPKEKGELQ